ncbi:CRISPR-associated endonuclease/helicase Cas3 [subsurface metagenome]
MFKRQLHKSMTELLYIWGKTKTIEMDDNKKIIYHPLICHLIDVAITTELYWEKILSNHLKDHVITTLFKDHESAKSWIVFLAGCHDLGKATPGFQVKIPELAKNLAQFSLDVYPTNQYHNYLSGEILSNYFKSELKNVDMELIRSLKYLLSGHHGIFPRAQDFLNISPDDIGNKKWIQIQHLLIKIITEYSGISLNSIDEVLQSPIQNNRDSFNAILIFIAGLISIADWIGSNDYFFNFYTDFDKIADLKQYYEISKQRAEIALQTIGWNNWKYSGEQRKELSFREVFPFIEQPRPLQSTLIKHLDIIQSPSLIIIEAPMGEGKTEAALYCQYYLERKEDLQGAYIALPTQATANQMFLRVQKFLTEIKKGLRVNLHLLHGNALLSENYEILKTRSKNNEGEESNLIADEWFTYRKRGLISPFGVGTIDQIFLSVLPLRYFYIRLFGLAGKVVLVDEVHSYDVYMSEILESLLYWLKLLGCTVILLSATLPSHKRKRLIECFYSGDQEKKIATYPRITICRESNILSSSFETELTKQGAESVSLEWVKEGSIKERIKRSLKQGGRIALICNKIRRAQYFYQLLQDLKNVGVEVKVLHSRFPFIQRDTLEKSLLEKFGRETDHSEHSRILISTQIIEQSLDIDFDLMISDLAPIDLLFQRMGRLHRHIYDKKGALIKRPETLIRPRFLIIEPELDNNHIPKFNRPIYSQFLLLKTYLQVRFTKEISIPEDIESMIEGVYGDNIIIPHSLKDYEQYWINILTEQEKKMALGEREKQLKAQYKIIPDPNDEDFFEDFSSYLEENNADAQYSLQAFTRITFPSINLVCLYPESDQLFFDEEKTLALEIEKIPDLEEAKVILDYTIRISHYALFKHFTNNTFTIPKAWKKNRLVQNIHYTILSKENNTSNYYFEIPEYQAYLSKELGLYITKK